MGIGSLLLAACLGAALGAEDPDPAEGISLSQLSDQERVADVGDSAGVAMGRVVSPLPGVVVSRRAEPWHREPKYIMMRSIAFPGWGQLANGRPWKALLVAAGEGYFVYRAIHYGREERDFRRAARSHPEDSPDRADLRRRADYAGDRRRDSVWWAIFSIVLSMGDAYVDAHLGRGFEAEFQPQDRQAAPAGGRGLGVRVGIRKRLS